MTQFDRPGATLERQKRRAPTSRLAGLGDRLARSFSPSSTEDRHEQDVQAPAPWEANTEAHAPVPYDDEDMWDETASSFPVVRNGYDRAAVDEYVAELEREIDELRARGPANTNTAVSDEIKKIGEQTASILQAAHQQASETTRQAQAEADKCLSDAAANAISMKEDAKQELRHLDSETDAVWHERSRLIEDVRTVATALFSLAEEASDRFPPEEERRLAGRSGGPVISRMTPSASTPAQPQPSEAETDDQPAVQGEGENSVGDGENHVRGFNDSGHGGPFPQS
jgi:cell division septum initiation protein DivIVA